MLLKSFVFLCFWSCCFFLTVFWFRRSNSVRSWLLYKIQELERWNSSPRGKASNTSNGHEYLTHHTKLRGLLRAGDFQKGNFDLLNIHYLLIIIQKHVKYKVILRKCYFLYIIIIRCSVIVYSETVIIPIPKYADSTQVFK